MPQEKDLKQTVQDIAGEAKRYLGLQKQYMRLTAAEKLTHLISQLIIIAVIGIVGFVVFIFAGLALVHYAGSLTGNLALCFAVYALLLVLLLCIFWLKRRSWIILPVAHMLSDILLDPADSEQDNSNPQNTQS